MGICVTYFNVCEQSDFILNLVFDFYQWSTESNFVDSVSDGMVFNLNLLKMNEKVKSQILFEKGLKFSQIWLQI